MEILLNGTEGYKEYEVQRVTLWDNSPSQRCKYLGSSAANPEIENDIIQPGDIIKIGQQEKLLTVLTKEQTEYTKEILERGQGGQESGERKD